MNVSRGTSQDRSTALRQAEDMFRRSERVDMQSVAQALGIGRATLYRWVGDRETLIDDMLATLISRHWERAQQPPSSTPLDSIVTTFETFLRHTCSWEPLRTFTQNEPGLALKILLNRQGSLAAQVRRGITATHARHLPEVPISAPTVESLASVGSALPWASIAAGYEPDLNTTTHTLHVLLTHNLTRQEEPVR